MSYLIIHAPDDKELITVGRPMQLVLNKDGTCFFGVDYKPDEAASTFWNAVTHMQNIVAINTYGAFTGTLPVIASGPTQTDIQKPFKENKT